LKKPPPGPPQKLFIALRAGCLILKGGHESLIMMPRHHPETNKNQHKRFAQHIGSPRRGAPGRRRQK
jgi:hypothetical protein